MPIFLFSTSIESGSKHRKGSSCLLEVDQGREECVCYRLKEMKKKQGKNRFVHFWPCPLLISACSLSQRCPNQEFWVKKKSQNDICNGMIEALPGFFIREARVLKKLAVS